MHPPELQKPARRTTVTAAFMTLLLACGAALAQDMADARDHPLIKRFAGSAIVGYEVRNFDEAQFQTGTFMSTNLQNDPRKFSYKTPPLHAEGKRTRIWYEVPGDIGSLEVYRNYTNELAAAGFKTIYDSTKDPNLASGGSMLALQNMWLGDAMEIKNTRTKYVFASANDNTIRTGTFQKDGTTVHLFTVSWSDGDFTFKARKGAYAALDIVEAKTMQQQMVVVSASEISQSITANGKVAIYGIYFDTGKADVKMESKPSLDQIAAYLKAQPGMRLHVVGHTDSVGSFDSNMQLSRRRADAVVASLVKDHDVAATRLTGNGVASLAPVASNTTDEGKAKNRRVELVPQ
ncbi:MAG: OmpA family protein [Pseudomonadota bacterium]|nr:OmpA family protein [Pseudomonadota bacterium]